MWFIPGASSVPPEVLGELRLCAHLVVLHRRRDGRGRVDEAGVRRETCSILQCCLHEFSPDEWGQETVMACYQRSIDDALSLDVASLRRVCGFVGGPDR